MFSTACDWHIHGDLRRCDAASSAMRLAASLEVLSKTYCGSLQHGNAACRETVTVTDVSSLLDHATCRHLPVPVLLGRLAQCAFLNRRPDLGRSIYDLGQLRSVLSGSATQTSLNPKSNHIRAAEQTLAPLGGHKKSIDKLRHATVGGPEACEHCTLYPTVPVRLYAVNEVGQYPF